MTHRRSHSSWDLLPRTPSLAGPSSCSATPRCLPSSTTLRATSWVNPPPQPVRRHWHLQPPTCATAALPLRELMPKPSACVLVARAALHLWFLIQLPSMWDVVAGGWVWPLAFASSVPLLFKVRRSGAFISRRLGPSGRGGHSLSMVHRVAPCCTVLHRVAPCCNVLLMVRCRPAS